MTKEELEALCDRLAVSVMLLAHEAHPVYRNTAGRRGGIGGSAITHGCSIIDPPPNMEWTQYDLPTTEARKWFANRAVDIAGISEELKQEWLNQLK